MPNINIPGSKPQSIRFLYNEIRKVAKNKIDSYHLTAIARTFDALDNSYLTLFNAQKVIQSANSAIRVTFFFSFLTSGLESSHIRVPNLQGVTGYNPSALDINAVTVPTGGDSLFDIQFSTDDNIWNSILTAPAHLPQNNKFMATISTFSGTQIFNSGWLRCIPSGDLTPTEINVELEVVPFQ